MTRPHTSSARDANQFTIEQMADRFIKSREQDKSESTIYNNKGHLSDFITWCHEHDIQTIGEFDTPEGPFHIEDYLNHVGNRTSQATKRGYVSTIRGFFKYLVGKNLLEGNILLGIDYPDMEEGELVRNDMVPIEAVKSILEYLEKMERASRKHAIFATLWHTGTRMGGLRAFDKEDYLPADHPDNTKRIPRLKLRHRPKQDTPLKNGVGGERIINLKPDFAQVIEDYIEYRRNDVTDDHGRNPLLTTQHGRPTLSTIQNTVYTLTRPCVYTGDCPIDKDPETCEWNYHDTASKCPESYSPHPLRRASITHHLKEGWTYEECSLRFNVSVEVLKKHYDETVQTDHADIIADRHFGTE